ncbi:matrix-remodeling-associated protein 7 [Platysternon megacephalum]|uniref:Matrix-remodeling-associated protein 7 n=1 Tax=Platysternon megacephalum TaxID=55544 RepID=A0A4D9DNU0_9SAUR|nr:matrix-remodeling-associated protein 7 [Platysternon megacephalum]
MAAPGEVGLGGPQGTELVERGPWGAELPEGEARGAELVEEGPWVAELAERVSWGTKEEDEDKVSMDCVICFSLYDRLFKVPKVLGCGHTFCLECLARINVSSEQINAVSCPVCRELTCLPPRKGLPGLPTCLDLLDQLPLAPAAPSSSVRFSRRRGLLYVPGWGTRKGRGLALPKPGPALSTVSLSVDVGRPAPRGVGGGLRGLGCSSWPFAVAVAVAVTVTVGLVISGVYIFFMLPTTYGPGPGPGVGLGNATWQVPWPNSTAAPPPPSDRLLLAQPPRDGAVGLAGETEPPLPGIRRKRRRGLGPPTLNPARN